MIAAVRSEIRKTLSTRIWWVLLLVMVGYMASMAAIIVLSINFSPPTPGDLPDPYYLLMANGRLGRLVYSMTASMAYVFPAMIGALSVTAEYRHQTLTPSFLAEPRRPTVMGAKLLAAIPLGLTYGLAANLAVVATGSGLLAALGEPTGLRLPDVPGMIIRSVLALLIWALVGVGFGAVLHHQVASIIVLIAFTQFIEPLLRMLPAMTDRSWSWLKFLPGAAGEGIAGQSFYGLLEAGGVIQTLSTGPAAVTLLTYAVVLSAIGHFVSFRRDVT